MPLLCVPACCACCGRGHISHPRPQVRNGPESQAGQSCAILFKPCRIQPNGVCQTDRQCALRPQGRGAAAPLAGRVRWRRAKLRGWGALPGRGVLHCQRCLRCVCACAAHRLLREAATLSGFTKLASASEASLVLSATSSCYCPGRRPHPPAPTAAPFHAPMGPVFVLPCRRLLPPVP
jgi:hypothetical protein